MLSPPKGIWTVLLLNNSSYLYELNNVDVILIYLPTTCMITESGILYGLNKVTFFKYIGSHATIKYCFKVQGRMTQYRPEGMYR